LRNIASYLGQAGIPAQGSKNISIWLLYGDHLLRPHSSAEAETARLNWAWKARKALGTALSVNGTTRKSNLVAQFRAFFVGWRMARIIQRISGEKPVAIIGFGSVLYYLSRWKRQNWTLIHTEHSKGGGSNELRLAGAPKWRIRSERQIEQTLIVQSDRLVFPSSSAVELFLPSYPDSTAVLRKKSCVVYNGISSPKVCVSIPFQSDIITVVNVAAHVPEKRVDLFLRGAGEFMRSRADTDSRKWKFVNYGKHSSLTTKLREIGKEQLGGDIQFVGEVTREQLLEAIAAADVIASVGERVVFDLVLLEAMSLGRPIIASHEGGNIEALGQGYDFFADTPECFAEQLNYISQADPDFVGAQNQSRFESNFSIQKQVAQLIGISVREATLSKLD
jgi:glycosyltransferase involved in cell wall biosynthesis